MTERVLVLDDEENFARMVGDILRAAHFEVESASEPEKALSMLEEVHFGLVISDYKMPEMNGLEFLRRARKLNPKQPIIMLSGFMNMPELLNAANSGATLILEKPFDARKLIEYVAKYVGRPDDLGDGDEAGTERKVEADIPLEPTEYLKALPRGLSYLAGASPEGARFAVELHCAVKQGNHVFVGTPEGSEVELVLQEVANWRGDEGKKPTTISMDEVSEEAFQKRLLEISADGRAASVVGVTGLLVEEPSDGEAILEFIRYYVQGHPKLENLAVIYFVELGPQISAAHQIGISLVRLPPLSARLGDLGVYIGTLSRGIQNPIEARAAAMLLSLGWPGNYAQLEVVIRRLVAKANEGPVAENAVLEALKAEGIDPPADILPSNLAFHLFDAQHRHLAGAAEQLGGDPEAALKAVHAPTDTYVPGQRVEDVSLLYPELLEKFEV